MDYLVERNGRLSFDDELTISTREIAVRTGREHMHVLRDARKMFFDLDIDDSGYIQIWIHPQNHQKYQEYLLPEGLALTLAGSNTKLRYEINQYFLFLRDELSSIKSLPFKVPQTFPEALRLAADEHEGRMVAEQKLLSVQPKVAFAEEISNSDGVYNFRDAAKALGLGPKSLTDFMLENGIIHRSRCGLMANERHVDAGRFSFASGRARNGHAYTQCLFTAKGFAWIGEKLMHHLEDIDPS